MNPEPDEVAAAHEDTHGIAARVLRLLATRLELLAFEVDDERRSAVELLILLAAGVTLALLGIVVLTAAVILALDPAWRAWGALVAGLLYAAGASVLLWRLWKRLRQRPPPFSTTVGELKRDLEWLKTLK